MKLNDFIFNYKSCLFSLNKQQRYFSLVKRLFLLPYKYLISIFSDIFLNKNIDKNRILKSKDEKDNCEGRRISTISEELYKRLVLPFYTLIISLIGASLILEPKAKYLMKFHKLNIFLTGTFVIILSQISLKFFLISIDMAYVILFLPIFLVLFFYLLLSMISKFRLNLL